VFCVACAGVTVAGMKHATTRAATTEAETDVANVVAQRLRNALLEIVANDMSLLVPNETTTFASRG
jgi:hypothetical protein